MVLVSYGYPLVPPKESAKESVMQQNVGGLVAAAVNVKGLARLNPALVSIPAKVKNVRLAYCFKYIVGLVRSCGDEVAKHA